MIQAIKYSPAIAEMKQVQKMRIMESRMWWKEQQRRCLEGYKPTGGTWIPGNYYFYLNFTKIEGLPGEGERKTKISPLYRDQDHEYFVEIHNAKKGRYGIIVLKARRKGFSFMNANILLHEWCCYENSQNGIGAQQEIYVQDFRKKILMAYNDLPKQLRPSLLHNNEDLMMSGYREKEGGVWLEKGMKSMIHFRVMEKPNAFRGTSLNYMIFEEAGEFLKLRKAYQANEECFREGALQFGTPIIGGTSNQMEVESDDYMEMFTNAENYNLKPVFISAAKVYFGYFNGETGVSDIEGATRDVLARAEAKKKGDVLENYFAFLQEMPLKVEDAFIRIGGTPFDLSKINKQISNIMSNNYFQRVQRGRLDWPKDAQGREIFGGRPVWVPDDGSINEDDIDVDKFPFEIVEHPLEDYKNAHVGGVDSYYIDDEFEEKKTAKKKKQEVKDRSKGAVCIYRRFVNTNTVGEMPVAFYVDRPYSKDTFYENCLKMAIYYDSPLLVEYNDDSFLKYFTTHKMTKYLKERPTSADSPHSQATNKYGVHMKTYQKKILTELIDEYVKSHWEDIYFIRLLNELVVYGVKNTDRAMAFGLALMHDADATKKIIDKKEEEKKLKEFVPHFGMDKNGNVVSIYSEKNDKFDNSSRSPTFDYGL